MALRLEGPMAAGKLRTPFTIQVNSATTADTRGEPVETWTTYATGRAQIEQVRRGSREIEAAEQRVADQWWDVLTRFIEGVTPPMRILWGAHVGDIQSSVDPDSRRRRLHLLVLERQASGT